MLCDELVGDLFPHLSKVLVERVFFECGAIRVAVRTRETGVACPGCVVVSNRVHSTYGRCLVDTPVGDRPVRIELTVRRLYCENLPCPRRTFAEQVEGLTVRYGRRTPAARRVLEAVAVALAGRAGSRLATVLHRQVSRTTPTAPPTRAAHSASRTSGSEEQGSRCPAATPPSRTSWT